MIRFFPGFTTWRCLIPPHSGRALMQPIPSAFFSLRRSRSTLTTQVCTSGTVRACAWICPSTALTAQRLPRAHLCSLPRCTPTPSSPPAAQPTQAKRSPAASLPQAARLRCCSASEPWMCTMTTMPTCSSGSTARTTAPSLPKRCRPSTTSLLAARSASH